jgi:hypothetical protein
MWQVDGHPVKGWDEKALLAHVMGEEGKRPILKQTKQNLVLGSATYATALMKSTCRHVLQYRI